MRRDRVWSNRLILGLGCFVLVGCGGPAPEPSALPSLQGPAPGAGEVVAEVDGVPVTLAQIEERLRVDAPGTYQAIFDARAWAVDRLVEDHLVAEAAAAAGITPEALMEREVTAKIEPVSDEKVRAYYDNNPLATGGAPFEQMEGAIRRQLETEEGAASRRAFMTSLEEKAAITRYLEPPRFDIVVTDRDRSKGPEDAAVTIVEYADFECPACIRAAPTLARIEAAYGDRVRFVYRDFPLVIHPLAQPAAEAARCAHAQGGFWEFHDKAFQAAGRLQPADLTRIAAEVGLDADAFNACVVSRRFEDAVAADVRRGAELGVTGTPTIYVNGRFLSGAQPFERLAALIDDELARAGKDR